MSFEPYYYPTQCYSVQKKNLKITKFDPYLGALMLKFASKGLHLGQPVQQSSDVCPLFQNGRSSVNSKHKLNCQLEKQSYRGDDVCIDFGVQMLSYSKKEIICLFDFVDGLKEGETFVRKRRVRLIWNESRCTDEKLRILTYHLSLVWPGQSSNYSCVMHVVCHMSWC